MWFRSHDEDRLDWMVQHFNRLRWLVLAVFVGFGMLGVVGRVVAIFHANAVDRLIPLRTPWNAFVFIGSIAFGIWFWTRTRVVDVQSHDSAEAEGKRVV